jgi:hypothetical protein
MPTWPRPVRLGPVALGLALFVAVWLGLLGATARVAPIDNVEQWVWSHAAAWGYYKHPPLPTWIAIGAQALLGSGPWVIDLLGGLCAGLSLLIFWALLRRLRGPGFATLALLATLCITYFTYRLNYFNHNTVLMPLAAAVIALCWRVTEHPGRWRWAAIGLGLGLGLLTKYQMVLVAVCVGLWWLRIGGWRHPEHRAGAVLGALVLLAVFWPHLRWLVASDWAPLQYARQSSLGAALPLPARPGHALTWLIDWMGLRLAPAWALLAVTAWRVARTAEPAAPPDADTTQAPERLSRQFLLLWGFGPPLLMVGLGLAQGIWLQPKWSTSFALWTVPAVLACLPLGRWAARAPALPRASWVGFGLLQLVLILALSTGQVSDHRAQGQGPGHLQRWSQRDYAGAAQRVAARAQAELGAPLEVISGPYGVAGAIAQRLPGVPLVLIDGELAKSPWLSEARLRTATVLHLEPACGLPPGTFQVLPGWIGWLARGNGPARPVPPPDPRLWGKASLHGGVSPVECP